MNLKKIDLVDYIVMALYVACGIYIYVIYTYAIFNQDHINTALLILTFGGSLILYTFYYKRFRILTVWYSWIVLGIVQAILVVPLRQNVDFDSFNGSYADHGWNLLLLLALITIFRVINIKLFNREFVLASRFHDTTERKLTFLDYLLSMLGWLILTLLMTLIYEV